MVNTQWETVIGIETHVQLKTLSKLFSGASTKYGANPNTQACAVDLGLPGVLPTLNAEAIRLAIMFGLAINAPINRHSYFERKQYFYPDLPNGYQITQLQKPIVGNGKIDIKINDTTTKTININRAHLEQDAGKLLHEYNVSSVDLNRAGIPLLEIVTEPDMRNAEEAITYLKKLHKLVTYLDISNGNMAEGSFRCDINISIRPIGQKELGTRTEIKNINSFKHIKTAIDCEIKRQIHANENNIIIHQETRQFDENTKQTYSMRSKETCADYRYFPDPDLAPMNISEAYINNIKINLPELPDIKRTRLKQQYNLSDTYLEILIHNKELSLFFEQVVKDCHNTKLAANWVTYNVLTYVNKNNIKISDFLVTPIMLSELLNYMIDNEISNDIGKIIFQCMCEGENDIKTIVKTKNLNQAYDDDLDSIIYEIMSNNTKQVSQYKQGKTKLLGFFIGQTLKNTKNNIDVKKLNNIIREKLDNYIIS